MRRSVCALTFIAFSVALYGCGEDKAHSDVAVDSGSSDTIDAAPSIDLGACATLPVSFQRDIVNGTFATTCGGEFCHLGTQHAFGLSLAPNAAYESLVSVEATGAPGKLLVAPGDPDASFLWHKLTGDLAIGEGNQMPFGKNPLTGDSLEAIRCWILTGAQDN
jgi:hypothetical protein